MAQSADHDDSEVAFLGEYIVYPRRRCLDKPREVFCQMKSVVREDWEKIFRLPACLLCQLLFIPVKPAVCVCITFPNYSCFPFLRNPTKFHASHPGSPLPDPDGGLDVHLVVDFSNPRPIRTRRGFVIPQA